MATPPHRRRFAPRVEPLESRDAPSASPSFSEPFDGTAPGSLPAGWAQWASAGGPAFAVTSVGALSAPNALASQTASRILARAWNSTPLPADAQAGVSLFLGTQTPAGVLVRGTQLGTPQASYYALTVSRSLHLQLVRVVNGVPTTLAQLQSVRYFSQQWARVTLWAAGTTLRAQVIRLDTGQYLTSTGTWQASPAWALTTQDAALPGGGAAGIDREAGYASTVTLDDFTANPVVSDQPSSGVTVPVIPQHSDHVRLTELAYTGTPFGPVADGLLRNNVDLVVSAPANLAHIHDVAPATPQLLYVNFSNIYGDLLTNWLAYADAHGLSREEAFYHAARPTPFSGASASSQPVNWFWGVYRDGTAWTDLTGRARGTQAGGVAFGGAGTSLYMGYLERFREINFDLSSSAGAGWSGVLEYATAVDAAGRPTAWAPLKTLTNTTAGWTQSGQFTFDPPPDWTPASVDGSAPLYFVRVRTLTAGTAPVARTILGRDYVNAHGTSSGVIPVFDAQADVNGDGYLNDAEYAVAVAHGDTARFAYESRLPDGVYGQMRFATDPADPGFRAWAAQYAQGLLSANPLASGLFVDNSGGVLPFAAAAAAEPTATYAADYAALLGSVGGQIAPHWLLANTAGGTTSAAQVIAQVPGYFEEHALRALAQNWQAFEDLAGAVAAWSALRTPAPYGVLDSLPTGGSPTDPRTQIATLAEYYLLADPNTTFLDLFGGYEPSSDWSRHFTAALSFDVGQPQRSWSLFASGADPSNASLTYHVYQRSYGNALVLYKPLSYGRGVTGGLGDATATTFALPGTFRALSADGSLGPPVTSITLRNGEGAILVRTGGT